MITTGNVNISQPYTITVSGTYASTSDMSRWFITTERPENFIPKQIIYSGNTTICFWKDGTKTMVRCEGDDFSEEQGVALCIAKKVFGNRSRFLKAVRSGKHELTKEEKKSRKAEKTKKALLGE